MEQGQLEKIRSWFDDYVTGFYADDDFVNANIELKDKHSRTVVIEMLWLADKLGLSQDQKRIAEAIALLHDVGRFGQFQKYRTYNDTRSINHCTLGIEVLRRHEVLAGLKPEELKCLEKAIALHGDKLLPENLHHDCLLFCQLIRDADKIDIYRITTDYYEQYRRDPASFKFEIELPNEPWYSQDAVKKILSGQRINYAACRTWNDMKLLQLAWVYDVNFTATLERIKQRQFLEKIIDFLPQTEDIKRVRQKIFEYVDSRINT